MASDSDEEKPDEKPPSTKQMVEALQIVHRANCTINKEAILTYSSNINLMKLAEKGKIQSTLDGFLSKN